MDEQNPAARAVDLMTARPPARVPFDPASLLDGRQPPPPAHAPGPTVVVVREFDPATFLGDRALRGAFNLATVKPLVTTIGGVEMVTVPASAYAYALRHAAAQELPEEDVEQAGPVPNVEGCMGLLIRLHEAGTLSIGQLVEASGLDLLDVGDRVAAYRAMVDGNAAANATLPAQVDVSEAHGAAFDDGRSTEAHGAALEGAKPEHRPRNGEVAFDTTVQSGEVRGGAMDRKGRPAEPTGAGMAAYDAERGSSKRSRR